MTHRQAYPKLMIIDACVLIDFLEADRSIIRRIVKYVGPVYVTSPVVDEVNDIGNEDELSDLDIIVVEPDMEDAFAAAGQTGPLSFQDRLCLLTAKRNGWTCVTNDKNLRKRCRQENVKLLWGLEVLAELHKFRGISDKKVLEMAHEIHASNPKHITQTILSRFEKIIGQQVSKRQKARDPKKQR